MFNAVIRYLPFKEYNSKGDPLGNPPEAREINSSNLTHTQIVSNK